MAWLYLLRRTDLFVRDTVRVLHIAAERCLEVKLRPQFRTNYITADLMRDADVKVDICRMDFANNSFDVVICSHVLEHVADDRMAICEFARVLRYNGWAVVMAPVGDQPTYEDPSIIDPKQRLALFGQVDHVRRYGPDIANRLTAGGFLVDVVRPESFINADEIVHFGIPPTSAGNIYHCTKSRKEDLLCLV
jgi:SAM-dependent methyltransferase